jgi:tetratricopeptide (TPR) repeat protein
VAGLVLFFIVLLGGGAGWVVRDRSGRLATTEREGETALAEATQLAAQRKWPEALAWVQRAEGVLADGGGSEALRRRVQDLRSDLDMAAKVDEIRLQGAEVRDEYFDYERKWPAYAEAFREYGIDVTALAAEEAAERIRARTIRAELAAALDDWAAVRRSGSDEIVNRHLIAVVRLVDPDPWRNRVRDAWTQSDRKALADLAASDETRRLAPQTLNLLQRALWVAGAKQEWLDLMRQLQQRHPDDFWTNQDLGVYLTQGITPARPHEAVRYFTAAVALRPRSPGARYNLGIALDKSGFQDEAVAAYHEALRLNPDYVAAYYNLGCILCDRKRDYDGAIDCFRDVLRLKPNYPQAHYNLGLALQHKGLPDEAIAAYREAIRLRPDHAAAYQNLGGLLCDHKDDYDGAAAAFREALRLRPTVPMLHFNLGNALAGQGAWDEAIASYRQASSLNPKFAAPWSNWASLLANCPEPGRRDPAQAVRLARKAVELSPAEGAHWHALAWAQYRAGDWHAAVAAMQKVRELGSGGNSAEWFLLAMAHWQLGAADEARTWYDRAVGWMDKNRPADQELQRFRAEAAALLGVKKE